MTTTEAKKAIVIKEHTWVPDVYDFISLLSQLNNGTTIDDLDAAFKTLLETVKTNDGKGTLTFTLTIEPQWLTRDEMSFKFNDKIALKHPDPKRTARTLFADRKLGLHTRNPFYTVEMDVIPGLEADPQVIAIREVSAS